MLANRYTELVDVHREVLGLRDASGLPPFARKLRRVRCIQDETLPVILTFGGLDPRDPLNYANGRCPPNPCRGRGSWSFPSVCEKEPMNARAT